MSNKNGNHKKKPSKNNASGGLDQWMDTLSSAVDKTIAAMPGITKKVTEEASKISTQVQKNPIFKDLKQKLIETGKMAGDKLGLSTPTNTAKDSGGKKKASAEKTGTTKKTKASSPVKKANTQGKKKAAAAPKKKKKPTVSKGV